VFLESLLPTLLIPFLRRLAAARATWPHCSKSYQGVS
jgi:hypothetical protein